MVEIGLLLAVTGAGVTLMLVPKANIQAPWSVVSLIISSSANTNKLPIESLAHSFLRRGVRIF